jgi:hypothetical protein
MAIDPGARRGDSAQAVELTDEQLENLIEFDEEPVGEGRHVRRSEQAVSEDEIDYGQDRQVRLQVTAKEMAKRIMYSPNGVRKDIRLAMVKTMHGIGYTLTCPLCGARNCGGLLGDCPSKPAVAWDQCPVIGCGHLIKDTQFSDYETPDRPLPEGQRISTTDGATTPEQRLRALMERHMLFAHPREAVLYGFERSRREVLGVD